jgi:hypothetical protein
MIVSAGATSDGMESPEGVDQVKVGASPDMCVDRTLAQQVAMRKDTPCKFGALAGNLATEEGTKVVEVRAKRTREMSLFQRDSSCR